MDKKKIRKIAVMLSLVQLLSYSNIDKVNADGNDHLHYRINEKGRLVVSYDDDFYDKSIVTDLDSISAFNDENTSSRQYGGNQLDFSRKFDSLINDPYIWNEIQKYYPVEDFASIDHAMDFYKIYFDVITNYGCGYVAVADRVFDEFKGKEKEFEELFGYPMYTIDEKGAIDFNYEIFTLEFFNFSVLYPNYNNKKIEQMKTRFAKSLAYLELERYSHSNEYVNRNKFNKSNKRPSLEELEEFSERVEKIEKEYKRLNDKWEKAEDGNNEELGVELSKTFGHVKEFLKQYGINTNISISRNKKYEQGDIVASYNFSIYKEREDGQKYAEDTYDKDHYVYVTGTDEQGRTIVSTWGEKYIYDASHDKDATKVVLKLTKGRK